MNGDRTDQAIIWAALGMVGLGLYLGLRKPSKPPEPPKVEKLDVGYRAA